MLKNDEVFAWGALIAIVFFACIAVLTIILPD